MNENHSLHVLVVDDERDFCEGFQESLEQDAQDGFQIAIATNTAEARAATSATSHSFDVMVIDQRLGREDGIGLMRELLDACPESAAIVLTAYTSPEDGRRAMEAGADDYIYKSAEWPDLFPLLKMKITFHAENRRTKRETEWLHKLNEIGQRFQACTTRDHVAQAIIESALTLGFLQARLWEIFQEDEQLWLKGWKQLPEYHLPGFESFWMERSESPYTIQTLAQRSVQKYQGREFGPSPIDHLYNNAQGAAQEGVWLDIPLWNEKRPLAKLALYHYYHARPLDQLAITVVELFAHQAAAALHRIQLFEQTEITEKLTVINEQPIPRNERELDELLDFIYHQLPPTLNTRDGFICLLDSKIGEMDFRIKYDNGARVKPYQRQFTSRKGLTGYMIASEKSLRLTRNLPEFLREHHIERLSKLPKAWLGAPIRYEKQILGVIVLRDFENERAFTDWDQRILEIMADQAAAAIQNAQLSMRAHRAAQQLEMLQYISSDVLRLAPHDLHKMLHVVLTAITASYGLGMNRAMLFLKNETGDALHGYLGIGHLRERDTRRDWRRDREEEMTFQKYLGLLERGALQPTPLEEIVPTLRLPLEDAPSAFVRVFRDGASARIVLPKHARELPDEFKRAVKPRGELWLLPLKTDEQILGVLAVDNRFTKRALDDETLARLQAWVNEAALAIENTQSHRAELKRQVERFEIVSQIMPFINATLDPEQVVATILREARRVLLNAHHAAMLHYESATRALRFAPVSFESYPVDNEKYKGKLYVEPDEHSIARQALEQGIALNVPDVRAHWEYLPMIHTTQAELCVPIQADKQMLGILVLESDFLNAFTRDDELLLTALADQTAITLKKAQEHEQLVKAQEESAANSAIAYMGVFGSNLAHSVGQYTYAIERRLFLIREQLSQTPAQVDAWFGEIDQYIVDMKNETSLVKKFPFGPQVGNHRTILDDKLREYVLYLGKRYQNVDIEFDLKCSSLQVRIQANFLEIPIEKLVNNAFKAMGGMGRLVVTSTTIGGLARVEIQDSGKGLREEIVKHFLFKQPVPRATLQEGTGYGLLIARKVLTDHGGDLEFVRTVPGQGTTFAFYLPLG